MNNNWFQRYLLPGFVFQSVVIAGAYGSGKELEQFFFKHGPLGGLLGMAVTTAMFSLVLMTTFEFARRFKLFDYRNFWSLNLSHCRNYRTYLGEVTTLALGLIKIGQFPMCPLK